MKKVVLPVPAFPVKNTFLSVLLIKSQAKSNSLFVILNIIPDKHTSNY